MSDLAGTSYWLGDRYISGGEIVGWIGRPLPGGKYLATARRENLGVMQISMQRCQLHETEAAARRWVESNHD